MVLIFYIQLIKKEKNLNFIFLDISWTIFKIFYTILFNFVIIALKLNESNN